MVAESPSMSSNQDIAILRRELAGLASAQHELVRAALRAPVQGLRRIHSPTGVQAGAMREISRTMQGLNAKLEQLNPRQPKGPSAESPSPNFASKSTVRRPPHVAKTHAFVCARACLCHVPGYCRWAG